MEAYAGTDVWVNGTFYNTAFSVKEQNAIVAQNVINEKHPDYKTPGGNNTTDKVFLLSIKEAVNSDYGFCSNSQNKCVSRQIQTTGYGTARGVRGNDSNEKYVNNVGWWLRSPGYRSDFAVQFHPGGSILNGGIWGIIGVKE